MFRKTKSNAAKKDATFTVISKNMHILGNIVHEAGTVDFNGTLDGNLRCETLTIRPDGVINGEINASTVMVYGRVNGLIRAKNVHLYAGSYIEGIIMHEQISIEDGAFLDGKCKRTDKVSSPALSFDSDDEPQEKPVKILENIRLIR